MKDREPTTAARELGLLLIRFRDSGDLDALEQIVKRTHRDIFGLALRLLRNRASAEDLTQEVYVIFGSRCANIRDPSRLRAWLRKVTVDRARRHRLPDEPRSVEELEAIYAEFATGPSVYDLVANADNRRVLALALMKVLSNLDPQIRTCLQLLYFDGLSAPEVARLMGVKVETVYTYRARGIATLRCAQELREYL